MNSGTQHAGNLKHDEAYVPAYSIIICVVPINDLPYMYINYIEH